MADHLETLEIREFSWPSDQEHSRLLHGVSRPEILQIAGALQLTASTSGELIVFHRLAAMGRSFKENSKGKLSAGRLKKILKLNELSGPNILLRAEDPEAPVTIEVPSQFGPVTIFQGLNSFSGMDTSVLLAEMHSKHAKLSDALRSSIESLSKFVLSISQGLATRAGISPNSFLSDDEYSTPQYSKTELDNLRQLVTFNAEDIFGQFTPSEEAQIKRLLFLNQKLEAPYSRATIFDETTLLFPFYEWGEHIIVHSPMDLLTALHHAVAQSAKDQMELEEFSDFITTGKRTILRTILEKFSIQTVTELNDSGNNLLVHSAGPGARTTIFQFVSPFDLHQGETVIPQKQLETTDLESSNDSEKSIVLVLSSFDTADQAQFYGIESGARTIAVHLVELEIILHYLEYDLARLNYFIDAVRALDAQSAVTSILDLFAVYRENQFSFYLSDGPRPTFIFVVPGSGTELLKQYYDEVHPRWFNVDGTRFSAKAVRVDSNQPNWYIALDAGRGIHFVESHGATVSLVNRAKLHGQDNGLSEIEKRIADSLFDSFAFWFNRFLNWFPSHLLSLHSSALAINLSFEGTQEGKFSCSFFSRGDAEFKLLFNIPNPSSISNIKSLNPDAFVIEHVVKLCQLLFEWSPNEAKTILQDFLLDCYFERMRIVKSDSLEQPLNSEATIARLLSEEQTSRGLDELGEYLRESAGFEIGDIPRNKRSKIIKEWIVPFFGDSLASAVEEHAGEILLPDLMLRHEALLRYSTKSREDFEATANDPQSDVSSMDAGGKKLSQISAALLSSRFLIEFSSFVGTDKDHRPVHDEDYDRLLALSSEVINRGALSDSLSKELADINLSILPSGRLGISRDDEFHIAVEEFIKSKLQGESFDASTFNWFLEDDKLIEDARNVFSIENGITLDDLGSVIFGLVDRLDQKSLDVDMASSEDILRYLDDKKNIPREISSAALGLLTLSSGHGTKEEFWDLGAIVRPWIFNRTHSILNQPIIPLMKDNTRFLIHGKRTLQTSYRYKLQQLIESRGEGKSKESKSLNSRINHKRGTAFEKRAADIAKKSLRGKVLSRFSKFGTLNLKKYKGKDLGDIDLLYADDISHSIWVAELKSILGGRIPREFAAERDKIYGKDSSAATRLRARIEVLIEHLDSLLAHLGFSQDVEKWTIKGVIIVENEILSGRLSHDGYSVMQIDKFIDELRSHERKIVED